MTLSIREILLSCVVPLSLLAASPAVQAADDVRTEVVHFAKGANGTELKGSIKGYGSVSYKIGASADQTMRLKLTTSHTATYFNLYGPGKGPGDEAIANSEMTDPLNSYEGVLPANGDYTVSVYMMRSAARRDEVANYTLGIAIDAAAPAASTDAKVAGTTYEATGEIPCSMGGGAPTGSCPFGVERQGEGSAFVTVTKPDGRTRMIIFEKGVATGYDFSQADNQPFSASKDSDLSTIMIGQERYEIPDAVPFGG